MHDYSLIPEILQTGSRQIPEEISGENPQQIFPGRLKQVSITSPRDAGRRKGVIGGEEGI